MCAELNKTVGVSKLLSTVHVSHCWHNGTAKNKKNKISNEYQTFSILSRKITSFFAMKLIVIIVMIEVARFVYAFNYSFEVLRSQRHLQLLVTKPCLDTNTLWNYTKNA